MEKLWKCNSVHTEHVRITCFWSTGGPLDSTLRASYLFPVVSTELKHSGAGAQKNNTLSLGSLRTPLKTATFGALTDRVLFGLSVFASASLLSHSSFKNR